MNLQATYLNPPTHGSRARISLVESLSPEKAFYLRFTYVNARAYSASYRTDRPGFRGLDIVIGAVCLAEQTIVTYQSTSPTHILRYPYPPIQLEA